MKSCDTTTHLRYSLKMQLLDSQLKEDGYDLP